MGKIGYNLKMKLNRFYTKEVLGGTFSLKDADQIHQIKNVFRMKENSHLIFFGDGFENVYSILEINKKEIILKRESRTESKKNTDKIHLAISLFKKENFELAVRMATEIGVTEITPFMSERSPLKKINIERLEKIVREAAEQSGWGTLVKINPLTTFSNLIEKEKCLILHTDGEIINRKNKIDLNDLVLCIGPEGGFTEKEIKEAEKKAFFMHIPTGILRAETAVVAISLLAKIQNNR